MTLSAGIVVLRREKGELRYLFLRAYRNWDFPKGEVKPGEDPLQTALREVREETGIGTLAFRWGYQYKETLPYRGGKKVARYYVAETAGGEVVLPVSPELGRPEHDEYRWCSIKELRERTPARLIPVVEWVRGIVKE